MNKIFIRHAGRIVALYVFLLLGYHQSMAQTSSFNFSAAAASVSGWINMAGDPSVGVVSATDPATGISVTSIATGNWHPWDVAAYDGLGAANGTFFPAAVMLNHWYQYNGPVSVYNPASPQLRISGLNRYAQYTLRMAGSSTSSSNTNPTRYTVAGNTVYNHIDVNSHNNTADGAVFNNVYPDTNGIINVYINTLPTTDVADITGLQIILANPALRFVDGLTRLGDSVAWKGNVRNNAVLNSSQQNLFINYVNSSLNWGGGGLNLSSYDTVQKKTGALTVGSSNSSMAVSASYDAVPTVHTAQVNLGYYSNEVGIGLLAQHGSTYKSIGITPTNISLSMKNTATLDSLLTTDQNGNLIFVPGVGHSGGWGLGGNAGINPASQYIGTTDAQPLAFRTNNQERMRVTPDGHVLIGATTDDGDGEVLQVGGAQSIDVGSTSSAPLSISTNNIYSPFVELSNINTAVGASIGMRYYNANGLVAQFFAGGPTNPYMPNGFAFHDLSGGGFDFVSANPSGFISWGNNFHNFGGSKMIFYPTSGNLLIGSTTDNGSRLQVVGNASVNGTITTKVVKVTPNGWSDYVFDSTYHLPALSEVSQYVRAHRHLPDIVSAAQVEQNGLDLGESQAAQLKKIEELTLYMIDLNRKVEELAKENKQLKKMISRIHSSKNK